MRDIGLRRLPLFVLGWSGPLVAVASSGVTGTVVHPVLMTLLGTTIGAVHWLIARGPRESRHPAWPEYRPEEATGAVVADRRTTQLQRAIVRARRPGGAGEVTAALSALVKGRPAATHSPQLRRRLEAATDDRPRALPTKDLVTLLKEIDSP